MVDDHLTFPDPPKTALDARVSELVAAANDVLRTQGRLRSLLRASKQILADIDLSSLRTRVVDAAMEITAARYGALGVLVPGDGMDFHVHASEGVDAAVVHLTGTDTLLEAVTDCPTAIRLDDLTQDPRAREMPPWLPPMHSFLGVPLRVCGAPYCNLYLTESAHGGFTEEDEQLVLSLAGTTELALENARLYSEMQRRQAWALASAEITERLQTDRPEGAIRTLADRLLKLPEMQAVFVLTFLPDGHRFAVRDFGDDTLPDRPAVLLTPSMPGQLRELEQAVGRRVLAAMPGISGYIDERDVVRYWLTGVASTILEDAEGGPRATLEALAKRLTNADVPTRLERDVATYNAATTTAFFPLIAAIDAGGGIDGVLADKALLATALDAAKECDAFAHKIGRVASWAHLLTRFVGQYTLKPGVALARRVSPEAVRFVEAHFGAKLHAQHLAMGASILALGREHGVPLPALDRLLHQLEGRAAAH